jgi:hypothetical protein
MFIVSKESVIIHYMSNWSKAYPSLIIGVSTFIVSISCYFLYRHYHKTTKEKYQIALGMIAPQNYFYAKCTNDCVRDQTGDSSNGQFQWLCTDKCAEIAKARIDQGIPDITRDEYQRYYVKHVPSARARAEGTDDISYRNSSVSSYWDSEYLESNYCMNEITQWCRERYCPYSNHSDCMQGCIRMRGVDCGGAVISGAQH